MNNRIGRRIALIAFYLLALVGTTNSQIKAAESTGAYGHIKEGLYTNSVFGFQIEFPANWIVLENEEARELIKAGIKIAKLDEKELDRNAKNRLSLLSLMKKPPGEPGNATVALSAMKQPASSASPLVLANLTRKGLSGSPAIKFDTDTRLLEIGNKQFATFDYTMSVGDRKAKGKCLVTVIRNYSITLFISNENDEDDEIVAGIVRSIKFY